MKQILEQFGKLVCMCPKRLGGGHLRGKQTGIDILCPDGSMKRTYLCDRCGATWTRKLPKAKESA